MDFLNYLINAIDTLPTLPTIYSAITEAMGNPKTSADKLAQIVSTDQVSSIKVLKVANSPIFGFRGRIETISQAVFYLGFNEIRNIVFALSVMNSFSKSSTFTKFKPVEFWEHSIATGITTRLIGAGIGVKTLENFFLAGILHDIGKLLFFQFAKKDFERVFEVMESQNLNLLEAEQNVFGATHTKAGQLLAQKWKLPPSLENAISYHHIGIAQSDSDTLTPSVYLGNMVAKMLCLGNAGNENIPRPEQTIWKKILLPPGFFVRNRKKLEEEFQHTTRIMLYE